MVDRRGGWSEEGINLMRGIGGAVIIAMPTIYTMEVWFTGMTIGAWQLIEFLIFGFLVNVGLNRASGFRPEHDIWSDLFESATAIGMAAILSFLLLVLLGTITPDISSSVAITMVAVAAVPVSLGFSVANTQFGGKSRSEQEGKQSAPGRPGQDEEIRKARVDLLDIGITVAGAIVFTFAVASTEEIILIFSRTTGFQWAGLAVFSILLTYGMVFVADFAGHKQHRSYTGFLQQPIPETLLAYSFSVLVGMLLLYLLGRYYIFTSLSAFVGTATVIGLPASVGGAAGRLIV